MTIPISSTTNAPEVGYAGHVPKGQSAHLVVESKLVDEATGIEPGLALTRGTDPERDVKIPVPGDDAGSETLELVGFASHSHELTLEFVAGVASTAGPFEDGDDLAVVTRGRIFVESETAAVAGDQVYVRVSGAGTLGAVSNAAVATETFLATGWVYRTSTSGANNICEIERR